MSSRDPSAICDVTFDVIHLFRWLHPIKWRHRSYFNTTRFVGLNSLTASIFRHLAIFIIIIIIIIVVVVVVVVTIIILLLFLLLLLLLLLVVVVL